jgi:hypothetical protein
MQQKITQVTTKQDPDDQTTHKSNKNRNTHQLIQNLSTKTQQLKNPKKA